MTATLAPHAGRNSGWAPVIRISDLKGASLTVLAEWRERLFLTTNTKATTRGADMAWYAIGPLPVGADSTGQVRLAIECDDHVMSWRAWRGQQEASGRVDMRFGYMARTFTSALLASIDARLLLVPLVAFWAVVGFVGARLHQTLFPAVRSFGARSLVTALALLPGLSAVLVSRADARISWVAWALACAISIVIYKAQSSTPGE